MDPANLQERSPPQSLCTNDLSGSGDYLWRWRSSGLSTGLRWLHAFGVLALVCAVSTAVTCPGC